MSLNLPARCWRGRDDCEPFAAVDAPPPGLPPERFYAFDYEPVSFVCVGCAAEASRPLPQDAFRVCWRTPVVDEMGFHDQQDLAHQGLCIAQSLAVIATRQVNGGTVAVPTMQGRGAVPESGGIVPADAAST